MIEVLQKRNEEGDRYGQSVAKAALSKVSKRNIPISVFSLQESGTGGRSYSGNVFKSDFIFTG